MKIPTDELFESLKFGYVDYKESLASGASEVDLAYIMGFCRSIEQILNVYGNVSDETILKIKKPIIGDRSFQLGEKKSLKDIDYEVPTFLRQK